MKLYLSILILLPSLNFFKATTGKKIEFIDPYEYQKMEDHKCIKPKGNIRSISSYNVNYTGRAEPNMNEVELARKLFKSKNLVEIRKISTTTKIYNSAELLIQVLNIKWKEKYEYEYNQGRLITGKVYKADSLISKIKYTTDNNGRIINEQSISPIENQIINERICKYESNKITEYKEKGKYSWGCIRELDSKGRVISSSSLKFEGNNFIKGTTYYTYKYLNNTLREKEEEGVIWNESLNPKGLLIHKETVPGQKTYSKYDSLKFEYDSIGNLIYEEWHNKETNVLIKFNYEYQYDSIGNITYSCRKSNFNLGSAKPNITTDWETFYYNEYY